MLLGILTVVTALVWAVLRGGGLRPRIPTITWLPLLALGLLCQALAGRATTSAPTTAAVAVVGAAALLSVGIVNFRLPGMAALTAGTLSNALVVVANSGMPVAGAAVAAIGGDPASLPATGPHHLLVGDTYLPWLADVLGVSWLGLVVSPGDALLVVGAVLLLGASLAGEVE